MDEPCIFALAGSGGLGERVAHLLGVGPGIIEQRRFPDGEVACRPLGEVRGRDVYVIASLHGQPGATLGVNDTLCRLLLFVGALKDAAAARVSVVASYLCYARQDRQTREGDPLSLRYLAQMLEALGTDCVMALDVHNLAAFQNAFRCPNEHLEANSLFVDYLAADPGLAPLVVVSPDIGGIKRAGMFRALLAARLGRPVASAYLDKQRKDDRVYGDTVVGPVDGHAAIILDDLISTGATLLRAAEICRRCGAVQVLAAATHAAFSGKAGELLDNPALDRIMVSNSVPLEVGVIHRLGERLRVLNVAPLLAAAISTRHGETRQ